MRWTLFLTRKMCLKHVCKNWISKWVPDNIIMHGISLKGNTITFFITLRHTLCVFYFVNTTFNVYALAHVTQHEYRLIFYQDAPSNVSGQSKPVTSTIMCYKMDDEKIIEAVCSFPCLWQVTNKSYKHAKVRENAWKVVGNQVIQVI